MKYIDRINKEKIEAFWAKYEQWVVNEGVRNEEIQWYLRRAQGFIEFLDGVPLKNTNFQKVAGYLNDLRYVRKVEHWQVDQAAEALRIMEKYEISSLVVLEDDGSITGIVHLMHLLHAGLA